MQKTGWAAITIGLAVIAAIFAYYRWDEIVDRGAGEQPVTVTEQAVTERREPRHPVPVPEPEVSPEDDGEQGPAAPEPPPPLEESDPELRGELATLFGEKPVEALLVPKRIVAHTVVTVDNLDDQSVPLRHWPVRHLDSRPEVDTAGGEDERLLWTAENAERYARYVEALETVDTERLVDLYVHYYPLFQDAYEDLGYPDRYFNDRLIDVIDHLLATPAVEYPLEVVRPKVLYEFADPDLEVRSWGQKTLIRMGPANMAAVQAKLREIRAEIVSRSPRAGGPPDDAPEDAGGADEDTAVEDAAAEGSG